MKITLLLAIFGLLLSGCSNEPQIQRIDASASINHCTVSSTIIECTMTNGNILYVNQDKIDTFTTWKADAWKKESAVQLCADNETVQKANITDYNYSVYNYRCT